MSALVVLGVFSLLEAGLIVIIGTMYGRKSSSYSRTIFKGLALRGSLCLIAVIYFLLLTQVYSTREHSQPRGINTRLDEALFMCEIVPSPPSIRIGTTFYNTSLEFNSFWIVRDTVQIIPFTLIDNGTVLAADLMPQSWDWVAVVQRIPAVIGGILLYIILILLLRRVSGGA